MSKFIELETSFGFVVVNVDDISGFSDSSEANKDFPTTISFKRNIIVPLGRDVSFVPIKVDYESLKTLLSSDRSVISCK